MSYISGSWRPVSRVSQPAGQVSLRAFRRSVNLNPNAAARVPGSNFCLFPRRFHDEPKRERICSYKESVCGRCEEHVGKSRLGWRAISYNEHVDGFILKR